MLSHEKNRGGLGFTPAGGEFMKQRMSERQGPEPRAERQFCESLCLTALSTSPLESLERGGTEPVGMKERGDHRVLYKVHPSLLGAGLSLSSSLARL